MNAINRGPAALSDIRSCGRVDVLGSQISESDEVKALHLLERQLAGGEGGYVCFTNVLSIITGHQDDAFQRVTNGSFLSLADGKPVYWVARRRGRVGHVPGPDFMKAALERFRSHRHFFYGSTPEVLEALQLRLTEEIPDLNVCGCLSPPFRELTTDELQSHYREIRASGAEFVWVGLGAPKQEVWMATAARELQPSLLFGVGAAFDFHAQVVPRAPERMRTMGLEWLYRLIRQPRRLWRRYLVTNSLFIFLIARQFVCARSARKTE